MDKRVEGLKQDKGKQTGKKIITQREKGNKEEAKNRKGKEGETKWRRRKEKSKRKRERKKTTKWNRLPTFPFSRVPSDRIYDHPATFTAS